MLSFNAAVTHKSEMSEARMPVLMSLDESIQRKRKREKKLGKTKMKRDRIVQKLSEQSIDADEVRRLQKLLQNTNDRISSMQGPAVSRPSAAQVIYLCVMCFCFIVRILLLTCILFPGVQYVGHNL